jgi:hypothetical protein
VKYHENPLNSEHVLKNEGQKCKIGPVWGRVKMGGEKGSMADVLSILTGNRTMKPVAII